MIVSEDELLGYTAAHTDVNARSHLTAGDRVFVLVRHHAHHAQRMAPGHDRCLVYRCSARRVQGH